MSPPVPDDRLRRDGARIEQLLDELRAMTGPPAYQRVEELVRAIVQLYGAGLERLLARALEGRPELVRELAQDELLSSLLLLHDLHPVDTATRIREALAALARRLRVDIELASLDDSGVAAIRIRSEQAGHARAAIESAVRDAAPEVTRVDVVDTAPAAPLIRIDLERSRRRP